MGRRGRRSPSHVLAAAAFAVAVFGDGFGGHDCPHHRAMAGGAPHAGEHGEAPLAGLSGPRSAGAVADAMHADAPDDAQGVVGPLASAHGGDGTHDPGEHGPCTCVGTCHGGSAAPLPGFDSAPVRLAQGYRPDRSLQASTRLRGERLDLYALPLPNAPPVAG